jgi:hypothetical protein
MRVSEEQAHALRAIEAGHTSGLSTQAVQSLIDAGIVVTHTGMSRRNLVKAGAIGAGAGIAVMAMPTVAAASSVQYISLQGGFYTSGSDLVFEISTNFSEFPVFQPSTDISDVSGLSILGTTVPVSYDDLTGSPRYIGWSAGPPTFTPGTKGTFSWDGDDGTTYYYMVTFSVDQN